MSGGRLLARRGTHVKRGLLPLHFFCHSKHLKLEQSGCISIIMHLEKSFLNGHFFPNFAHFAKREMHLVQRRGDRVGEDEREFVSIASY